MSGETVKTVVVAGASGLVGRALVADLEQAGFDVRRLVRRAPADAREVRWAPERSELDPAVLDGARAVVHLGGESVASGRWTEERKRRIRDSRVLSTETLRSALQRATRAPGVWVCASAVGYYGDRGNEVLSEASTPGDDFLASVCRAWEAATRPLTKTRVVNLRLGIVLAREGGALEKMLPPFKLGLGGRIGSGRQYMSWVSLNDVVRMIRFALEHESIGGAVNAVAAEPATNSDFTRALAAALGRPALLPVPAVALKLALGEFATEVLSSKRVVPEVLRQAGFSWQQPKLAQALTDVLGA